MSQIPTDELQQQLNDAMAHVLDLLKRFPVSAESLETRLEDLKALAAELEKRKDGEV